jgi:hypothetical protein
VTTATATDTATATSTATAPTATSTPVAASGTTTAPPTEPINAGAFTELVPGGFLCGPGQPMFTKPDHSQCLCHGVGNPPLPPRIVACPKK